MSNAPLMPKATAVWLVDNTAADPAIRWRISPKCTSAGSPRHRRRRRRPGHQGHGPISNGQLTRLEIEKGEKDPNYRLKLEESKVALPPQAKKKGPRYTPVSRRHERPSAILWLVRNHPELKDRPDHAPGRHHQDHHRQRARPHPLECLDPDARWTP